MRATIFLKRLFWIIFWIFFILVMILGGWKLLSFFPSMESYLSSVITTSIGLVIGVPIALAINDYQRKLQATETSKQLEHERLSKEILLLQYINKELELNKSLLENAIQGQKSKKKLLNLFRGEIRFMGVFAL
jgi:signal transduction protein with GAF and PtsI domain